MARGLSGIQEVLKDIEFLGKQFGLMQDSEIVWFSITSLI